MCEEFNQPGLDGIKQALLEIPEALRADVIKDVIRDIGIMGKAISIMESRNVA